MAGAFDTNPFGGQAGTSGTCAIHVGTAATGTCVRCGNYVCPTCTDHGRFEVCPTCRERFGPDAFPLSRDRYHFGAMWDVAFEAFRVHWLPLSLASLILFTAVFVFGLCSNMVQGGVNAIAGTSGQPTDPLPLLLSVGASLMQQLIQLVFMLGLIHLALRALSNQAPNVGEIFAPIGRLPAAIVQALVIAVPLVSILAIGCGVPLAIGLATDEFVVGAAIAIGIAAVLFIPIVYVTLGLACAQYELIYDPTVGPIEALRRSWTMVDGHRLMVFLVGLTGGGILLAGTMVCCVGVIPAQAFYTLLLTTLFRTLRNGAGLPEPPAKF